MQCLNKQEVNLDKYLENITCNLILSYKKRIKINYNLNKKIRLKIEENTFNILFENLFSNAIKFSDE
jgi:signal transduction histidine kinase